MAVETLDKFPEYLQDFEEIQLLAKWQNMVKTVYENKCRGLINSLKGVGTNDRWEEMVKFTPNTSMLTVIEKLHRMHTVVTVEELSEYISCWMGSHFKVRCDPDALTIKVSVTSNPSVFAVSKIRELIPCNMLLEIELVEELS